MNREFLFVALVAIITAVWLLAVIGGIYRRDWTAMSIITPVIVTIIGIVGYQKRNGK